MVDTAVQEECQFFYKVGVCRHGSKCVRRHSVPKTSKVIVLSGILSSNDGGNDETDLRKIEQLVQNIFIEVALVAPVQEFVVAANKSPHLKGTVYLGFSSASDAEKVLKNINSRWFNRRPMFARYLPCQTINMALCREGDRCQRRLDCNYAHPHELDKSMWTKLYAAQAKEYGVTLDI